MAHRLPIEDELIPFTSGFPPGARWLVVAPHPDDELFGMGATLAEAVTRGVTVKVAVVTDGAAQGDKDVREREACAASAALGLAPPEFWGFADRSLAANIPALREALFGVLEHGSFDAVFITGPVDLHPDHRALALALQSALRWHMMFGFKRGAPKWVVSYEVGVPILPNLLVAATKGWEAKCRAGKAYLSQLAYRPYDRFLDAMGIWRTLTLEGCERAEAFFVLPATHVARLSARRWAALMGSPRGVTPKRVA
jgi:LmbE family N-acetylglucosaminyl deacetylase